jgi:hypothetical protein
MELQVYPRSGVFCLLSNPLPPQDATVFATLSSDEKLKLTEPRRYALDKLRPKVYSMKRERVSQGGV